MLLVSNRLSSLITLSHTCSPSLTTCTLSSTLKRTSRRSWSIGKVVCYLYQIVYQVLSPCLTLALHLSRRVRSRRRSSVHVDIIALVVAQAYKLKVLVVIIRSSCNFIKSFINTYHLVSHSLTICHDVYARVDAQAYEWTTFLVNK